MTTDLWMLVAAAGWQWILIMAAAAPAILLNGIVWAAGNRETPSVALPAWAERAARASGNMMENLAIFASLVLVVHVSGEANATSALGAQIFVGARLVQGIVHIAGIPWVRTLSWVVSIVGMAMVASVLF